MEKMTKFACFPYACALNYYQFIVYLKVAEPKGYREWVILIYHMARMRGFLDLLLEKNDLLRI